MKAKAIPAFAAALLLFNASCNSDRRGAEANQATSFSSTDSVAGVRAEAAPTAAPLEEKALALNDPSRKIIKTADLRCRVGDVYTATTRMEHLAAFTGGQIVQSSLENLTDQTHSLPYKTDSLKQVESYTTTAHLTLRIPVMKLDTVLADIAVNASFINSRNLHLDDMTLRHLSNKLKNDALSANDAADQARRLARRSKEAVFSGEYADERSTTAIDRRVENMQLTDQVTYATLTVDLYQPQRIAQMVVPDVDCLMKPSIGQRAVMALNSGWHLLQSLLLSLLEVWPLIVLALAGTILYRRWKTRRRLAVRA